MQQIPLYTDCFEADKIYKGKVVSITDGDTIHVTHFLHDLVHYHHDGGGGDGHQVRFIIRLYGINTPELRIKEQKEAAVKAKSYLSTLIPIGTECDIIYQTHEREKYGRYLATVYVNGKDVCKEMISSGHAVHM